MVKKNSFNCLFFCSFTLLVCGERNMLPNLTNSQEPEPIGAGADRSRVFLAPWSLSRSKKNTRSRSRLGKKSRAGAACKKKSGAPKKFAGSPALGTRHRFLYWIIILEDTQFSLPSMNVWGQDIGFYSGLLF